MKKLTIAILMLIGTYSMASAELGINVGISGQVGVFHATGKEVSTHRDGTAGNTTIEDATGAAGYNSFFIEKTLPGPLKRFAIGYEYSPDSLATETVKNTQNDMTTALKCTAVIACVAKENTVKLTFEDLTTYYMTLNLTENFYVKAGIVEVDVMTQESLATGSTYANTSLDGSMMGLGASKKFDSGVFLRFEGIYMEFDNKTLTSETNSTNTASLNSLEGAMGKLSVGKTF